MPEQKTIILPGLSVYNEPWLEEARTRLALPGKIIAHAWKHWQTGKLEDFSPEEEVGRILQKLEGSRVNILAKSVGTQVAIEVLKRIPFDKIGKIILCGLPSFSLKYGFLRQLKRDQLLCFQNAQDPYGEFATVANFLKAFVPEINIVEKASATHDYPYFEDFQNFLSQ